MGPFNCFLLLANDTEWTTHNTQWEKYYALVGFRWQIICIAKSSRQLKGTADTGTGRDGVSGPLLALWFGTCYICPCVVVGEICLWKYNQRTTIYYHSAVVALRLLLSLLCYICGCLPLPAAKDDTMTQAQNKGLCKWMSESLKNDPNKRKEMVIYFDNFSRSLSLPTKILGDRMVGVDGGARA